MFTKYLSDNKKFSLNITIKCRGKKTFRVWAQDSNKVNSKYADRQIDVEGERTIYFSFPVSPKELLIVILNVDNIKDKDFEVTIEEKPLKDYNIALDQETLNFLKLAIYFSQVSGFSEASPKGVLYQTDDDQFRIKYYDIIRHHLSGKPMNTPARIGHKTGIIEVAKAKFDTILYL